MLDKIPAYAQGVAEALMAAGEVWIVGSEARALQMGLEVGNAKDVDLIVSRSTFGLVRAALNPWNDQISKNTFNGWKVTDPNGGPFALDDSVPTSDKAVDVWLDDVGSYLSEVPMPKHGVAISLNTGRILMTSHYADDPSGEGRIPGLCRVATGGAS